MCELLNDQRTRSTPSPLWGEGWGEGKPTQDGVPPHPNPLGGFAAPKGEREQPGPDPGPSTHNSRNLSSAPEPLLQKNRRHVVVPNSLRCRIRVQTLPVIRPIVAAVEAMPLPAIGPSFKIAPKINGPQYATSSPMIQKL